MKRYCPLILACSAAYAAEALPIDTSAVPSYKCLATDSAIVTVSFVSLDSDKGPLLNEERAKGWFDAKMGVITTLAKKAKLDSAEANYSQYTVYYVKRPWGMGNQFGGEATVTITPPQKTGDFIQSLEQNGYTAKIAADCVPKNPLPPM